MKADNYVFPEVIDVMNSHIPAAKLLPLKKLQCDRNADYATIQSVKRTYKGNNSITVGLEPLHKSQRQRYHYQSSIVYSDSNGIVLTSEDHAGSLQLLVNMQVAAALNLAKRENDSYLYGVPSGSIYGLLTDPNIDKPLTPKTVTIDGTDKITWPDKLADTHNAAYHLYNDFNALWENLNSKNKGLIGHNTHMVLGLSPQRTLLLRTTPAGSNLTVESMLKSTWPNLELVVVPELSTAEGEKLYLIVNDEKVGLQAGFNAFSQRLQVSKIQHKRIFHLDKETSAPVSSGNGYHTICIAQDFSGATFGCVITQPSLISYMVGI